MWLWLVCRRITREKSYICGTFEYIAPEFIKELPYNQGLHVWSLGVLLYELTHGFSPYEVDEESNGNDSNYYNEVFKNILKNNLLVNENLSDNCKDLIKSNVVLIKL